MKKMLLSITDALIYLLGRPAFQNLKNPVAHRLLAEMQQSRQLLLRSTRPNPNVARLVSVEGKGVRSGPWAWRSLIEMTDSEAQNVHELANGSTFYQTRIIRTGAEVVVYHNDYWIVLSAQYPLDSRDSLRLRAYTVKNGHEIAAHVYVVDVVDYLRYIGVNCHGGVWPRPPLRSEQLILQPAVW